MLKDYSQAFQYFQEAGSLDETKTEPLSGMIYCRIMQGKIDDAEKELEFMQEVQISEGRSSDISFLEALLSGRKELEGDETQEVFKKK